MSEPSRADELREEEREFPMGQLWEALPHLRRPFAPAAVRWKVQSAGEGYGIVIAYIDARLVLERLNLVVGSKWEDEYRAHAQGVEECALSLYGVTRRDVGTGSGPQAAKGMRSDALKRAAVKFGVGVSIYALKSVMMKATSGKDATGEAMLTHNKETGGQKKYWSARLSPRAERWLAEMYEKWLEQRGEDLFGPVLDHGDEVGAQGLEGAEQAVGQASAEELEAAPAGPVLDDERALRARNRVRDAYGRIRKAKGGAKIPPAVNKAAIDAAAHSHVELEALAERRERQAAQVEAGEEMEPEVSE